MANAQSEVDVANRALIRLGLQTITAATDNPSTFASAITNGDTKNSTALLNTHFDEWKKELLRSHPWNFATNRISLINPRPQGPNTVQIKLITNTNPIVVDMTPENGSTVSDHFIDDYEVVELIGTVYSTLNNNKFYAMRGEYDAGGTAINKTTKISLYERLPANGVLPADASSITGISADGTSLSAMTVGQYYNTGSTHSFNKQEFSYEYDVPKRVLRLLNVKEVPTNDQYRLQRRSSNSAGGLDKALLCNVDTMVNIEFIEDITLGDHEIDRSFMECLSLKIAHKLSETLLKTATVTNEIFNEFTMALSQAKSIDAQESSPVRNDDSTWVEEMGRET